MSASDSPVPVDHVASSAARRKSGRVSKKPDRFAPVASPTGSTKRKRGDDKDSGVDTNESGSEEESEQSSEGEPDEEELRERRRKKNTKAPARKPAPKKAKTNGESLNLAIRPATNATKKVSKRPRKAPIRKSALPDDTEGLYADVFASGDRLEHVTARWVTRFNEHEAKAVAEIVNLVLQAAGCDLRITEDDIADPDNAPDRVAEIQEEFQQYECTEYPLIAKAKDGGGHAFRNALHGFFLTLIQTVAQSGLMYESVELIENISVWLGAMSSTGNRPIRHTSTVASLAITTALAQVAADIVDNTAKRVRQSEAEAKKSRVNKARVSAADHEIQEYNQKLEFVAGQLDDWFTVVYVHRYRDVDPRIRVDSVIALADWIIAYPDKFFDGTKLRYLGWVLADPHPSTRIEVLHQLARLFRDESKLAGLKTFTERFRPRIVEMATLDAEINVRTAAIDLLDILREAGFLEPDDIDSVGKLIFVSDAKVRKAVVGFFAENVNAAYEATVEDMGGEEALNEALAPPDEDDEEYHNPRLEWLKLRCLVDQLLSYDEDEVELPSQIQRMDPATELALIAAGDYESRRSLAAQALYDAIPEIRSWEVLAGYLLYDHSQTAQNEDSDDAETLLRQHCRLEERHETVLLDVLNAVVRIRLQRLADAHKDKKKTKTQRESDKEDQADMARRLSLLIPQLLKKFGALPETAALCLRLERELNLDVFEELRQNAALVALLDDINKQFLTHHNERVLGEAIGSILHAQGNEELRETVDLKVQALWDDLLNTFDTLRRDRDFSVRGNLDHNILAGVSNIVLKMAQLVTVSNGSVLDQVITPAKTKGRGKKAALTIPPIDSVLQILDRGVVGENLDAETEAAEDTLVRRAMSVMLMYFMWKCRECTTHMEEGSSMPEDDLTALVERRDACVLSLMSIMESRKGTDEIRLGAADLLLDTYTMFRALQSKKSKLVKTPKKPQGRLSTANDAADDWEVLCRHIDTNTTKLILQTLTAWENNLAKLTNKRLEEPDVDDDPIDPDDEPLSDDDDEEDASADQARSEKQMRAVVVAQTLYEFGGRIVKAVLVGALDSDASATVRKRLERNKTKLDATWKEVVNFLDVGKLKKKGVAANNKKSGKSGSKMGPEKSAKSNEVVELGDDDEEEEEEEEQREVPGDEIEDEEMADDEPTNGVPTQEGAEKDNPGSVELDADEESILGD
ncbi:STAG-domain-containing protein [Decorospora gaudefroyi]|uniref:STAG-domain-containing protein n=1 Tax=Decorospora gaudefroyi TaxID=184978 RepID=A0A6A5KNP3_9PLEO|nr:STAG-domain-containing protein [Decorospora gaudefroyi]